MTLKKGHLIILIIVSLIFCILFILVTFTKKKTDFNATNGDITIMEDIVEMTEEEKKEIKQNMDGDKAVMTEEIPILICNITDVNNSIMGTDYLPFIAMASYHDKITEYLEARGHVGTLNLSVLDEYVYKKDNYYYFAFLVEETQETLFCSFNELNLDFDISCS